jgi:hypothetical protein
MYASRLPLSFVLISLIFLTNACTQTGPYRTSVITDDHSSADIVCDVPANAEPDGDCTNAKVKHADAAIQHRHYKKSSSEEEDYYLSFVEFDDQGWFADRNQMDALMRLLETLNNQGEEILIFVFAHGWRHNASACDDNVVCFQRILERFDLLEGVTYEQVEENSKYFPQAKKRTVVGVYLGWRGKSASVQPFELMSFWDRKNTAQRVGLGGTTELLTRLNDFRRYMNPKRLAGKTQLITMGHSFGGKVIYTALSRNLIERAARKMGCKEENKEKCEGKIKTYDYSTANSFGDFVILINPAYEGSKYEPLYDAATHRCYNEKQRPVMMVVTSETDQATKLAFPAGRYLSNTFESTQSNEQRKTVLHTVGHLARYRTHNIKLKKKEPTISKDEKSKEQLDQENKTRDSDKCGCPYLQTTDLFWKKLKTAGSDKEIYIDKIVKTLIEEVRESKESKKSLPIFGEDDIEYGKVILTRNLEKRYSTNHPYLVIKASEELIRNHNEIYGEEFTNFVRWFYIRHIKYKLAFPVDSKCK